MTRSIFDPTGPDTEHSGSRNLGPDAEAISHLPPTSADGRASAEGRVDEKLVEAVEDLSHPGRDAKS